MSIAKSLRPPRCEWGARSLERWNVGPQGPTSGRSLLLRPLWMFAVRSGRVFAHGPLRFPLMCKRELGAVTNCGPVTTAIVDVRTACVSMRPRRLLPRTRPVGSCSPFPSRSAWLRFIEPSGGARGTCDDANAIFATIHPA